MFRAHECSGSLRNDSEEYKDCMTSIKFYLGDIDGVADMYRASTLSFFKLPFEVCLFQVTQAMDVHFFLAKQVGDNVYGRGLKSS